LITHWFLWDLLRWWHTTYGFFIESWSTPPRLSLASMLSIAASGFEPWWRSYTYAYIPIHFLFFLLYLSWSSFQDEAVRLTIRM
jgi:hypothetical protein